MSLLRTFLHDARLGLRSFSRAKAFYFITVLVLALGIGHERRALQRGGRGAAPAPSVRGAGAPGHGLEPVGGLRQDLGERGGVLDYRRHIGSFAQVAAWSSEQANLTGDGEPVRVGLALATPNVFSTLGAAPLLGRSFPRRKRRPPMARRW